MTIEQANPDLYKEPKEDYTYEEELFAYADMVCGRKVHRYQRNDMSAKNDPASI